MKVEEIGIKRKSLASSIRGVVQHPIMERKQYFLAQCFAPSTLKRCTSKELLKDERVSPLRGSFEGLPPLCFVASDIEIFRDCSIQAAAKAEKAGVITEAHIWKGVPHCFPVMFSGMLPEAKIARDDMVDFIKRNLHATPTAFVSQSA